MIQKVADWEATESRDLAQNKNFGISGLIVLPRTQDLGRDIRWEERKSVTERIPS